MLISTAVVLSRRIHLQSLDGSSQRVALRMVFGDLYFFGPRLYCFGESIERCATDGEISAEKRAAATPTGKMAKTVVDGSIS